jgi:putative FmdB family regulatory protein
MPIYEYQCTACGHHHEALQKVGDAPLVDCPACGASALKKKVSAAAFRLKGGGWYETDFKSGNKKNLAGDDGAPKKEAGDAGKGDTSAKSGDAGSGKSSGDGGGKDSKSAAGKKSGDSSAA